MNFTKKILIVIPAKNEENTIGEIIDELKNNGFSNILVIDDYSNDNTFLIGKEKGAIVLKLPVSLGTFGAISTGFLYAVKNNYDIVITMDADGQHPPSEVKKILNKLLEENADLCIATYPERYGILKKIAAKILKIVSGLKYEDILSGFRGYSKRLINYLADKKFLTMDYQDIGVLLIAKKEKMKVVEIDVKMNKRKFGKSRVYSNSYRIFRYMLYSIMWSLFKRW